MPPKAEGSKEPPKGSEDFVDGLRNLMAEDPTKKMIIQMNIVAGAIGLAVIVVGAMGTYRTPKIAELVPNCPVGVTPIIAISIGFAVLLLSIFGIAASLLENEILVYLHGAFFVFVAASVTVMTGFALYSLIRNLEGTHLIEIRELLLYYNNDTKKEIDYINRQFKCCGLDGYESWEEFGGLDISEMNTSLVMPVSCCEGTDPALDKNNTKCTRDHATYVECDEQVVHEKFTMALYSFATGLVLLGFFSFVVICSCFLATEL